MRLIGVFCAAFAAFVGFKLAARFVEYQDRKALEEDKATARRMYEEASGKSYPESLADSIRRKVAEQQSKESE